MCVTTNNRTVGHRVGVHAKVLLMGLCIAVFSGPVQCQGKTAGAIVAVDVAPAAHEVTIRSDRPMTAPKGVVLHRPNRLAMDFDSSRIGPVPGKIKVEKAAVREIRLGCTDAKARVVIDFGENPVPPHTIIPRGKQVIVRFEKVAHEAGPPSKVRPEENGLNSAAKPRQVHMGKKETTQAGDRGGKNPANGVAARMSAHQSRAIIAPQAPAKSKACLKVKEAGASSDIVFLELEDDKDPDRKYRVVLEVDPARLRLVKGSMTDNHGKLNSFQFAPDEASRRLSQKQPGVAPYAKSSEGITSGPSAPDKKTSLKWGAVRTKL